MNPSFSFLHPWHLVGLFACALPIIIHLIGKRRAPTVRFAAFDFLLAISERVARRERLRQFLLLLARVLALCALAVAVARPMPTRQQTTSEGSQRVVFVLDVSASMQYLHLKDGRPLLHHARQEITRALSHLAPGDNASLVIAGDPSYAAVPALTGDLGSIRDALARQEDGQGSADMAHALDLAAAQLAGAAGQILVVSDLAASSFEGLSTWKVDPAPQVTLIDAAERDTHTALPNVLIQSLSVDPSADTPTARKITVQIQNLGPDAVEQHIELQVDGVTTQKGTVVVAARAIVDKVFHFDFGGPGTYTLLAQLVGNESDGFAYDDGFMFVVDVAPPVRLLAVDGDPRAIPYEDELFFVERALEVTPEGQARVVMQSYSADDFETLQGWEDATDVVLLANVGDLSVDALARLSAFVGAGHGLLMALGDHVDFEKTNEHFAALLPSPLRALFSAEDQDEGTPAVGAAHIDWSHPVFDGLGKAFEESLRASRTSRYFNLDVGSQSHTLSRFSTGAPLLVEQPRQAGRAMLWTTSLDVDFTDLPLRTGFVALLQRLVRYLGNAQEVRLEAIRAGEAATIRPPTGAAALVLTSPQGERLEQTATDGAPCVFPKLHAVGVYTASIKTEQLRAEPRLNVVVNASLQESDFATVSSDALATALAPGGDADDVTVAMGATGGEDSDPFARRGFAAWWLLALVGMFVFESVLASRG